MKKNLLWIFLIISLILCIFSVDINVGSAVEYPAIMVIPESTWNETLTPGMNYTVSIYTNYTGDDVWCYQFTLYYNPNVLHGGINGTSTWTGTGTKTRFAIPTARRPMVLESETVYVNGTPVTRYVDYTPAEAGIEFSVAPGDGATIYAIYLYDGVVNGDLITAPPDIMFKAGAFNNTIGKLDMPTALFLYGTKPPPTTSGPGILANVTFTVVGYGFSDITIGDETILTGYTAAKDFYEIINAYYDPDHIQHGFFCNIPPSNDVAVSLDVPGTVAVEQPVPINVTVENQGTYDENVTLTVYNDTTVIDSKTFLLEKGLSNTFSFSWDTSGLTQGTYTINATATVLVGPENPTGVDDEPGDNIDTKLVQLELRNDVAVVSLQAPDTAVVEQPVPISVTVVNEGSYDEEVTLTVYNETSVIDSTSFGLAKGPTSNTVDFSWNASGVGPGAHTINATAVIASDSDLSDNNKTQPITLELLHDVAVSLDAPFFGTIEQPVPISVTVVNEGSYDEEVTLTVYNETSVIDSTSFGLAKGPTSNTFSCSWDTSGVAPSPPAYTISANATVLESAENPAGVDDDPADNTVTQDITLEKINDVAVVSVTAPRRGNVNDNVLINVTVENKGSFTETFNVTTYYNETAIVLPDGKNYTTVTLAPAESTTILFTWNTTSVSPGFYTIKAKASVVQGETFTDQFNNVFTDGTILVTILGDVEGDGAVDTSDLIVFNEAYGSKLGDSNWDVYCDLNGDDKIDASDLFDLSKNYGKSI